MTKETKALAPERPLPGADILATFEAYKAVNDERLEALEAGQKSDPLIDEKLSRMSKRLDTLSLKSARTVAPPETVATHENEAWVEYLRRGDDRGLARLDTKALSSSSDAQGGYVAPPELDRLIEARLMQSSPMRQIATVRQTMAGVYRKPVSLGVGAQWAGEIEARTETSTAGLSLLEFPAGELYAMPAATQTLLDDAYADLDAWLADEVDAAFSVQESAAFVTGDGVHKPKGFLTYPQVSDATQSWGQIGTIEGDFSLDTAGDHLIDLIHAVKAQFRGNGRFVMNRKTVAAVRKLKDGDGRYLWAPGAGGDAATILGYPVTELEDMPDMAPGKAAIAFGDFQRGYLIADRQGARVLRDPFSSKPYVLFYTTKRVGGGIQNFDALKLMVF